MNPTKAPDISCQEEPILKAEMPLDALAQSEMVPESIFGGSSFYIQKYGREMGPYDRASIERMRAGYAISGTTPIRSVSNPKWVACDEALAMPPSLTLVVPWTRTHAAVDAGWEIGPARPWYRFGARMIDGALLVAPACMALSVALFMVSSNPERLEAVLSNRLAANIIGILLLAPMCAFCLAFVGTTPGKWIAGIRVRRPDSTTLSLSEAFSRELHVAFFGCAMGLPLISLIAQWRTLNYMEQKNAASWDNEGGFVVQYKTGSAWLAVRVWLGLVVSFALVGALASIE